MVDILVKISGKYIHYETKCSYLNIISLYSTNTQIIPWMLCYSNYPQLQPASTTSGMTIFVGGLHGMMTAYGLFCVMNDLFGSVCYSGIDTDRYKYPIGEIIFGLVSKWN